MPFVYNPINGAQGSLAWAIVADNLLPICPYTSIGEFDQSRDVKLPDEPIEKGQLATYNNVNEPKRVNVTLFVNGDFAIQLLTLAMLDKFMEGTDTCTILSPAQIWRNMALEHYDYTRTSSGGASLLAVNCSFKEIVKVDLSQQTISSPKRATSSAKVNTGQASTKSPSFGHDIVSGVKSLGGLGSLF